MISISLFTVLSRSGQEIYILNKKIFKMCLKPNNNGTVDITKDKGDPLSEKQRAKLRVETVFGLDHQHFNFIWLTLIHLMIPYRIYICLQGHIPHTVILFEFFVGYIGGLGITIGAHRYWTHKSFKAKLPLQWLLMILQTIAFQHSIYKWTLDHRIHHKHTDTDADPHTPKNGFWFSHMGWAYHPKHPELKKKLKTFKMTDLENDPVVMFQSKYYWVLLAIFHFAVPMSLLHYCWGLPWLYAFASNCTRHAMSLEFAGLVNSAAHIWGWKPYDKSFSATDNPLVSLLAAGEGWHNYHHAFPWDYKASELGWTINMSTVVIDFFAWIGWAYDLKTVSKKMLTERQIRTGEIEKFKGSNEKVNECEAVEDGYWGWDDDRIPEEMRKMTKILRPVGNVI